MALIVVFSLNSCNYFKRDKSNGKEEPIARAFDKYLYKSDLENLIPAGATASDSLLLVNNYIDNWIRQNVILQKAESNLSDDEKNVEDQLQKYRSTLITYIYQRELIKEKLDTVVSAIDIEKYYSENQSNFQLHENIIKFLFVKVDLKAPKLNKLREWYKSTSLKDRALLEDYCYQFATDYFLNDNEWISFDQLVKKTGIKTYNKEEYLQNNRTIEITDSTNITFVYIKDYKIKDSLSPLSFEMDNIRNLIINKRKLQLVQEMEKAAYQKALKENDFEIYKKK